MDETNEQNVAADTNEAAETITERDALIKAVEAVGEPAEAEASEAPKAAAKEEPKPAEPDAMSKVGAVLRAREQAQKIRDEAAEARKQLEADRAAVAAERAEAAKLKEEAARERDRILALKSKPLEAIKELGWDTKQLVNEVVREGTPEWQAQKRYEAQLQEQSEKLAKAEEFIKQQQDLAKQNEERQASYARQQTETQFLSLVPETSALRALYDEAEIIAKGHAVANAYRNKTGEVASLEELRDYLEEQAALRLSKIRGEQPGKSESAAKPKANGPRTLSASSASERRTSPKPIKDMTPSEEYEALKAAAADAMRTSA